MVSWGILGIILFWNYRKRREVHFLMLAAFFAGFWIWGILQTLFTLSNNSRVDLLYASHLVMLGFLFVAVLRVDILARERVNPRHSGAFLFLAGVYYLFLRRVFRVPSRSSPSKIPARVPGPRPHKCSHSVAKLRASISAV